MTEQIYLLSAVSEIHVQDLLREAENDRRVTEAKLNTRHMNWFQKLLRIVGL